MDTRQNHDAKDKKNKDLDDKYKAVLKMTKDILGEDAVPDPEAAHDLIKDATFVGLTGNYAFFKDEKSPVSFKNRQDAAVQMAVEQGYASRRIDLVAADRDDKAFDDLKTVGGLKLSVKPPKVDPEKPPEPVDTDATIYSFTVLFPAGGAKVDDALAKTYEKEFQRAIEAAA